VRAGTWILFFLGKREKRGVSFPKSSPGSCREGGFFFFKYCVHRQTATSCCVDGMYACAS